MADASDTPTTPGGDALVTGLRSFADGHGGATAVIEYVGRRGARIVLVGEDGTWGDQFAAGTDVARTACERAGITVESHWERELTEQIRPSNDLWKAMGRRPTAR